ADYTVWRDNLGDADEAAINFNGDGGGITASDYLYWRSRFGNTSNPGSAFATSGATPEPASGVLALLAASWAACASRRRRENALA
ncbi:MAG: hypothetical protein AAF961_16210, partial [Planctomycetota bacterium]